MADYDNTNRGVLFRNDKKDSDNHPDYTGKINIDGDEKRLAAWLRESKSGNKFLSISISEFQPKAEGSAYNAALASQSPAPAQSAMDDEIPF